MIQQPIRAAAPWLAAAAGLALTLATFYPGYMSFDSAQQWRQARTGEYTTMHPPIMAMLWRLTDSVVQGPGGMLWLQALLFWGALALTCSTLRGGAFRRAAPVLFVGFWPPLFGLLPHIWKDVWVFAGLALVAGLLRLELARPSRGVLLAALAVLGPACAFRHNALPAAVPFAVWIAWRWVRHEVSPVARRWRAAAITAAALGLVVLFLLLPSYLPGVRRIDDRWAGIAFWDLAAVSLAERRLLFPAATVDSSLTLSQLAAHFVPYTNATIFATGKFHNSLDFPFAPQQRTALREAWFALPWRHTGAYLEHRGRLGRLLFGWNRDRLPDHLVFNPDLHHVDGNPRVAARWGPLHVWVRGRLDRWVDTPLFAGWLYLLAGVALGAVALKRRRSAGGATAGLALATAASGLCYALPLLVVSPSADFRYLGWLVLSVPLAALNLVPLAVPREPAGGSPLRQGSRLRRNAKRN